MQANIFAEVRAFVEIFWNFKELQYFCVQLEASEI